VFTEPHRLPPRRHRFTASLSKCSVRAFAYLVLQVMPDIGFYSKPGFPARLLYTIWKILETLVYPVS